MFIIKDCSTIIVPIELHYCELSLVLVNVHIRYRPKAEG